jgi:hypothetical protein
MPSKTAPSPTERKIVYRPGTFARVTPSGGLQVDERKLLNDPTVQSAIRILQSVPLAKKA